MNNIEKLEGKYIENTTDRGKEIKEFWSSILTEVNIDIYTIAGVSDDSNMGISGILNNKLHYTYHNDIINSGHEIITLEEAKQIIKGENSLIYY